MDLLLATRNRHKTEEFFAILGPDFQVRDLTGMEDVPEVEETGSTLAENAMIKALAAARLPRAASFLIVADDSGLEVDSLGGAPGVYSARYAGISTTDEENVAKLLRALEGKADRRARFRCVLALVRNECAVRTVEGTIDGVIVDSPRGQNGFGYDPVFQPDGMNQTFAELSAEAKNRMSHRARAIRALLDFLKSDAASGPRERSTDDAREVG